MERENDISVASSGSSGMNTTVVVCTYNRCQSLPAVLESLAFQVMPDTITWEIVVIDNNSTDKTREVVEEAARKWPGRFRYIFEHRQGLSFARNRGVSEAQVQSSRLPTMTSRLIRTGCAISLQTSTQGSGRVQVDASFPSGASQFPLGCRFMTLTPWGLLQCSTLERTKNLSAVPPMVRTWPFARTYFKSTADSAPTWGVPEQTCTDVKIPSLGNGFSLLASA